MSLDVLSECVIQRPPAEVASFAADPDNAPAWYANTLRVEWRSERPLRVGSRIAFVAAFLGRRLEYPPGRGWRLTIRCCRLVRFHRREDPS